MATRKEELEEAAAEMAEPLAAQVAALRADLAELGGLVATDRKGPGDGTESGRRSDGSRRLRQGREGATTSSWPSCSRSRMSWPRPPGAGRSPRSGSPTLVGFLLGVLFRR